MKALKKGILKRVSHDDVHDHSAAVSVSEGGDCFYDAPEARFCGTLCRNSSTYWEVNLHQIRGGAVAKVDGNESETFKVQNDLDSSNFDTA